MTEPTRRELAFPTVKLDRNHILIFRAIQDHIRRNKTIGITAGLVGNQTISTTSWTPIEFDDVYVQDHVGFRNTDEPGGGNPNRFFAPMDAWYAIAVHAMVGDPDSINRRILRIGFQAEGSVSNEAAIGAADFGGTGSDTHDRFTATVMGFRYMVKGQWISCNVWHNDGSNANLIAGRTGMSMVRLPL